MKRAKLRGLRRNAAIVLGNTGTEDDLGPLATLAEDADPMLKEHGDWASRQIMTRI
jgi:epoxyqueuosine reductase